MSYWELLYLVAFPTPNPNTNPNPTHHPKQMSSSSTTRRLPPALRLPLTLLLYSPLLIFLTDHVASLAWVTGRSMSPTLSPPPHHHHNHNYNHHHGARRDCILAWKWRVRDRVPGVKRGDVVVFRLPMDPERGVVKRVVAVEGDLVLPRRRAAADASSSSSSLVEVPQGHIWVEGDEGFHSRDSNDYGPVTSAPPKRKKRTNKPDLCVCVCVL